MAKYFVAGGAGFIGSHLTLRLLDDVDSSVTVYDNLTSGRLWRLGDPASQPRLHFVQGDLKDRDALTEAIRGHDEVFHFAANPDIAKAATQPDIDFWEGTYLTQNLLEAMRVGGVRRLTYASSSGVYGDTGEKPVFEDYAPLLPISAYGASKLGCEALASAYCHMFDLQCHAYRFANVVGPRQTHGVAYDFIRRLARDPARLEILGDGQQSKSYIHVDDVVDAMLLISRQGWSSFEVFNVGTEDHVTVREIAELVCHEMGLSGVEFRFGGGRRGWKGDVPVVRFTSRRLRARGWTNRLSTSAALIDSIRAMLADARADRLYA